MEDSLAQKSFLGRKDVMSVVTKKKLHGTRTPRPHERQLIVNMVSGRLGALAVKLVEIMPFSSAPGRF